MRASDHRREETVAVLRAGALAGCLTLDTFAERVGAAYSASLAEELDDLVADLPPGRRGRVAGFLRRLAGAVARRPVASGSPALEIEVRIPTDVPTLTVGRASECDVVVGERTVSRFHAELRHAAGRWSVRDLDSKNGTWLNGRRVREAPVAGGDVLRLGALRMDLRL
jgi:hypothetical protein